LPGATACGGGPGLEQTPRGVLGLVWVNCREVLPRKPLVYALSAENR
jgi:hypothetical protein